MTPEIEGLLVALRLAITVQDQVILTSKASYTLLAHIEQQEKRIGELEKALGAKKFWEMRILHHKAVTYEDGIEIVNNVEAYWKKKLLNKEAGE